MLKSCKISLGMQKNDSVKPVEYVKWGHALVSFIESIQAVIT